MEIIDNNEEVKYMENKEITLEDIHYISQKIERLEDLRDSIQEFDNDVFFFEMQDEKADLMNKINKNLLHLEDIKTLYIKGYKIE